VELLTVIKSAEGSFTEPFPWYVKVIWACILVGFLWLTSIAWANQQRENKAKLTRPEFNPYNPDLDIVCHGASNKQTKKTN